MRIALAVLLTSASAYACPPGMQAVTVDGRWGDRGQLVDHK